MNTSNKEKLFYINLLNVVSAISVIMLHTNCFWIDDVSASYWKSANIIECLFYFAVPVFFMNTGATLIDYQDRYDKWQNSFEKDGDNGSIKTQKNYDTGELATHIQVQREINGTTYYNVFRIVLTNTGDSYCAANKLYGAVWNDYAEYRPASITTPGYVVREDKSGIMQLADDRLLPACEIISDTFGFAIGETDECKTPIAATGRVLAYPYEDRNSYELGDPVCSGPGGTVSKMSREEVRLYPERMLGYVSEIPSYKTWGSGNVEVNGRIWIRVK